MTRLDRALRWWARHDGCPIHPHVQAPLWRHGCIRWGTEREQLKHDTEGLVVLTPKGRREYRRVNVEVQPCD